MAGADLAGVADFAGAAFLAGVAFLAGARLIGDELEPRVLASTVPAVPSIFCDAFFALASALLPASSICSLSSSACSLSSSAPSLTLSEAIPASDAARSPTARVCEATLPRASSATSTASLATEFARPIPSSTVAGGVEEAEEGRVAEQEGEERAAAGQAEEAAAAAEDAEREEAARLGEEQGEELAGEAEPARARRLPVQRRASDQLRRRQGPERRRVRSRLRGAPEDGGGGRFAGCWPGVWAVETVEVEVDGLRGEEGEGGGRHGHGGGRGGLVESYWERLGLRRLRFS